MNHNIDLTSAPALLGVELCVYAAATISSCRSSVRSCSFVEGLLLPSMLVSRSYSNGRLLAKAFGVRSFCSHAPNRAMIFEANPCRMQRGIRKLRPAMGVDDIINYHDLVSEEKAVLEKGMNYGVGKNYSIFLMSLRENAPYVDVIISYKGRGSCTQDRKVFRAATDFR